MRKRPGTSLDPARLEGIARQANVRARDLDDRSRKRSTTPRSGFRQAQGKKSEAEAEAFWQAYIGVVDKNGSKALEMAGQAPIDARGLRPPSIGS